MENRAKIAFYSLVALCLLTLGLIALEAGRKPKSISSGPSAGDLDRPRGLTLDSQGALFVADSRHHRVVKRSLQGAVIMALGRKDGREGTLAGQFREPCDVTVDKQGNLYVADTFYTTDPRGGLPWGRIQKFNADGNFVASFGRGAQQGELFGPRGIAVDGAGFVYLSDTGNHRVLKFAADGTLKGSFGKRGSGRGEFIEPFGLAFDKEGKLYVVDRLNFRIQVFSDQGAFVREWKVDGWEEGQSCEPYVAIDKAKGWIYVSDNTKRRVHRYDLNGGGHKLYPKAGDGTSFGDPIGLAVDPNSHDVLVSDAGLGRIVVLKP